MRVIISRDDNRNTKLSFRWLHSYSRLFFGIGGRNVDGLVVGIVTWRVVEIFVAIAKRVEIEAIENEAAEFCTVALQRLNRGFDIPNGSEVAPDNEQNSIG